MKHRKPTSKALPVSLSASVLSAGLTAVIVWMAAVTAPAQDPVREDYGMVRVGENLFRAYCRSCHGATAEGNGPLADSLRVTPANLTLLEQQNGGEFPFEETTKRIDGRESVKAHGSSDMPVWGKVFIKTEDDSTEKQVQEKVLALTHYIRSLQVAGGSR